jgi:pimeloyl-ACP methyl ester carboxylesterase
MPLLLPFFRSFFLFNRYTKLGIASLILVPGSNGGGDIFAQVVPSLATFFQVVTYDRRGFSRSKLTGTQDYSQRLHTDVEDLRRLVEHLGDKTFSVFGTDSGAIVGLNLLTRYGDHLLKVVVHEPPLLSLLPDTSKWQALFEEVFETYQKEGVPKAMHLYASSIRSADHRLLMPFIREQTGERGWPNATYWMEHELRQYSSFAPDLSALSAYSRTGQLILTSGHDSQDQFTNQPNKVLAQNFGLNMVEMPGGHLGYLTYPVEFANELVSIVGKRS